MEHLLSWAASSSPCIYTECRRNCWYKVAVYVLYLKLYLQASCVQCISLGDRLGRAVWFYWTLMLHSNTWMLPSFFLLKWLLALFCLSKASAKLKHFVQLRDPVQWEPSLELLHCIGLCFPCLCPFSGHPSASHLWLNPGKDQLCLTLPMGDRDAGGQGVNSSFSRCCVGYLHSRATYRL